jgi:trigger factor
MLDKIIEDAEKIEWPLAFEEENLDDEVKHYEYHLKQSGMTLDSYLNLQNKTEEDLREETREAVVNRIKRGLVLSKIAELEKLNVSESEILEQAKTIADYSGGGDQVWRNILASERQQSLISNDLLSSKTILHLAAIAKGEAPEPGANEVPASEDAQQDTPQEAADESKPENEVSNEAADDESAEEPIATQA